MQIQLGLATEFSSEKIPQNRLGRNAFRYSVEESAHSEAFRGLYGKFPGGGLIWPSLRNEWVFKF